MLRSHAQLRAIVADAPGPSQTYRYDVIFLREPFTAVEAMRDLPVREGVDRAYQGDGRATCRGSSVAPRKLHEQIITLPGLSEYDHPQLEHHGQTPRADGRPREPCF